MTGIPPLLPVVRDVRPPLSHTQQGLWFLQRLDPESVAYRLVRGRRFRGDLAVDALRRALATIVRRHEVLRTAFPADSGVPYQEVRSDATCELAIEDGGDPCRAIAEEVRRPFDVGAGPLVRARLIRVAPDDHVLIAA